MSRTRHARPRRTTDVLAPLARLVGRLWRQETRHFRRYRADWDDFMWNVGRRPLRVSFLEAFK